MLLDGWMDGWMDRCRYGWTDVGMDGKIAVWMDRWVDERMEGWMETITSKYVIN